VGDASTVSVADIPIPEAGSSVDGLGAGVSTESDDDDPEHAATITTSIIVRTAITNFRKDMCTRELSTLNNQITKCHSELDLESLPTAICQHKSARQELAKLQSPPIRPQILNRVQDDNWRTHESLRFICTIAYD